MNKHLITALLSALITCNCSAEPSSVQPPITKPANAVNTTHTTNTTNTTNIENSFSEFSKALTTKNVNLFIATTDAKSIYIVRKFTSGNLGGRGEGLSQSYVPSSIDKELAFAVKKQTPFELPSVFLSLPIKSFDSLPKYPLPPEIDTEHFDQWAPLLQKSLAAKPEATSGDPVILFSPSSKYWVYAEGQIINNALAGSFAVFSTENKKPTLVAIIEFL